MLYSEVPLGSGATRKNNVPRMVCGSQEKTAEKPKVWRAEVLVVGTSYSNRGVGKDKAWKSAEARKTTVIWRVSLIG